MIQLQDLTKNCIIQPFNPEHVEVLFHSDVVNLNLNNEEDYYKLINLYKNKDNYSLDLQKIIIKKYKESRQPIFKLYNNIEIEFPRITPKPTLCQRIKNYFKKQEEPYNEYI